MHQTLLTDRTREAPRISSRDSVSGAGWTCRPGHFKQLMTKADRPFSWIGLAPIWQSRNDKLVRWFGDPTNDRRRAWMAELGANGSDLVIDDYSGRDRISFLVMGDTGEGDASQYAVVPPLLSEAAGTEFLFICSDVIYPAGGIESYRERFYRPYAGYQGPIYAVPGNHDWYDDLTGFMFHFCGAEQQPPVKAESLRGRIRNLLSSKPKPPDPEAVKRMRALRSAPEQQGRQPAPYFAIDAGPLRLVGIDTGITGVLDRDQAEWLRRVSRESARPKVLLTGKPIYVDGKHRPGKIEDSAETVDDIVRDPAHNYVAAIGGDIHNYQRYPLSLPDGRVIQYIVNGGGGAFMHATHKIPRVALPGVDERAFRCYPLRGDSLSLYSKLYDRKLGFGRGKLEIAPDEAAAIMAERLGIAPTRPSAEGAVVNDRARKAAAVVFPLPGRGRGLFHLPFSEFFDWNDPPLFKSFLRVEAEPGQLRIRCFAATGCVAQEEHPPVEDELTIAL